MLKNKPIKVIQIVPQLPPYINGLGDYAMNLARQLRKDYKIQTHFVVGDRNWQGVTKIEDFTIQQVATDSAEALLSLLSFAENQSVPILLHYVGYGYANRGCPSWLVKGLEQWKSRTIDSHLVTMFHEVYASGYPVWTSSFWLSPWQKKLAERLVNMSDRCLTSKQLYAEILATLSQGKHDQIPVLPVFSTIGEPDKVLPLTERQQRLVIFGGVANRARVYQESQTVLEYVCHRLNIQEIWDVGTPIGVNLSSICEVPILEIGEQPAKEVSDILANSVAGFSDYNPDFLAKSSIFASYCAHQLLPINVKGSASVVDGIKPGKHYWVPNLQSNELGDELNVQAIAENAYSWYQKHRLLIHTRAFADSLY